MHWALQGEEASKDRATKVWLDRCKHRETDGQIDATESRLEMRRTATGFIHVQGLEDECQSTKTKPKYTRSSASSCEMMWTMEVW